MMESQRRLSSTIFFVLRRPEGSAARAGAPARKTRSVTPRRRARGASARLPWLSMGMTTTLAMTDSLGKGRRHFSGQDFAWWIAKGDRLA
jgi:hypothetical protein